MRGQDGAQRIAKERVHAGQPSLLSCIGGEALLALDDPATRVRYDHALGRYLARALARDSPVNSSGRARSRMRHRSNSARRAREFVDRMCADDRTSVWGLGPGSGALAPDGAGPVLNERQLRRGAGRVA